VLAVVSSRSSAVVCDPTIVHAKARGALITLLHHEVELRKIWPQ